MLYTLLLLVAGASAPQPVGIALLDGTPDYCAHKGAEQVFAGTLQRSPDRKGYRLITTDAFGRGSNHVEVDAPGKAHLLDPHVGEYVRIRGKLAEGKPPVLAPARLEWFGKGDRPSSDGIIARAPFALGGAVAASRTVLTTSYRTAEDLAAALRIEGPTRGQTVTKWLQAQMRVPAIDWSKQAVIAVRGGLVVGPRQLVITRVRKEESSLVVYWDWKMNGSKDGGIQVAGEMALVPRHEGPVVFRREATGTK